MRALSPWAYAGFHAKSMQDCYLSIVMQGYPTSSAWREKYFKMLRGQSQKGRYNLQLFLPSVTSCLLNLWNWERNSSRGLCYQHLCPKLLTYLFKVQNVLGEECVELLFDSHFYEPSNRKYTCLFLLKLTLGKLLSSVWNLFPFLETQSCFYKSSVAGLSPSTLLHTLLFYEGYRLPVL